MPSPEARNPCSAFVLTALPAEGYFTQMRLTYTAHARDMLAERRIPEEWVERAVAAPFRAENQPDGTTHYLSKVSERGERILRVVVNDRTSPRTVVTVFFDRRLRRQP